MSSRKRRIKRKIAQMVRMDINHDALYLMRSPKRDSERAQAFWYCCMKPLGIWLAEHGYEARTTKALHDRRGAKWSKGSKVS